MASTESIRINDYATERKRTTSTGTKSHFTVEIQSEPLNITTDELALGAGIAVAIKDVLAAQIKGITATATASTLLARKYARDAFARGSRWAKKRYSGGRTGATPPGNGDQLFNDSGRLANNLAIRVNSREKSFTINAPRNRLDESTFGSRGAFLAMLDRLRELVPGLRNPQSLLGDPKVDEAIRATIEKVLVTKADKGSEIRREFLKSGLELVREALGVADEIAEEGGE